MEKRFKELGGKIYYNCPVEKIVINNKKVAGIVLENSNTISGDYFIATLDTNVLFNKLIDKKYMPKEVAKSYEDHKAYPSTSGFQAAFTVDKNFNPGETVFIDIAPIKVGARVVDRMYVKVYGYDPLFVKDNKQVLQINVLQSDEDYEAWKKLSDEEYKATKSEYVKELAKRIEATFPEIKGGLHFLDSWTPLTYERYCGAYHGSYMSFMTTPGAAQIRHKGNIKGIKNLVFAGQWNTQPGGLPVAVTNGKFAVQRLCHNKGYFAGDKNDERRAERGTKEKNTYDSTDAVRGKRVS